MGYSDCVPLGGVRQSLREALKSWTFVLTASGVYEIRLYTPGLVGAVLSITVRSLPACCITVYM
jgi:hypothetical protein